MALELNTVSTTYETVHKAFVYRIVVDLTRSPDDNCVTISRTKAADPMWSHGVMTELVAREVSPNWGYGDFKSSNTHSVTTPDAQFRPACIILKVHKFRNVDEAVKFIESQIGE